MLEELTDNFHDEIKDTVAFIKPVQFEYSNYENLKDNGLFGVKNNVDLKETNEDQLKERFFSFNNYFRAS